MAVVPALGTAGFWAVRSTHNTLVQKGEAGVTNTPVATFQPARTECFRMAGLLRTVGQAIALGASIHLGNQPALVGNITPS